MSADGGPDQRKPAPGRSAGGWVIFTLFLLAFLAGSARMVQIVIESRRNAGPALRSPADYGFDMSSLKVPESSLAMQRRPGEFRPQHYAELLTPQRIREKNEKEHGKTLVATDRVIGVVLDEQSRCYPLRFLNWHEVCNDRLGESQIAVTYCGLTDSASVFLVDGAAGNDANAGSWPQGLIASGLLADSNTLLTEEELTAPQATLWRQVDGLALAGKRAGERLPRVPMSLLPWGDWLRLHPETTVAGPDPARTDDYKSNPYGSYFQTERLQYPVAEAASHPADGRPAMTRCLLLSIDGADYFCSFEALKGEPDPADPELYRKELDHGLSVCWRAEGIGFSQDTAWLEYEQPDFADYVSCQGSAFLFACLSGPNAIQELSAEELVDKVAAGAANWSSATP